MRIISERSRVAIFIPLIAEFITRGCNRKLSTVVGGGEHGRRFRHNVDGCPHKYRDTVGHPTDVSIHDIAGQDRVTSNGGLLTETERVADAVKRDARVNI